MFLGKAWVDGGMDGWMDGWMDGQMDGGGAKREGRAKGEERDGDESGSRGGQQPVQPFDGLFTHPFHFVRFARFRGKSGDFSQEDDIVIAFHMYE